MSDKPSSLPGADLDLIRPDLDYLVGVSGGRDSMVLLSWLSEQGFRNLVVCHFNHCLRGKDSEEDARFVQRQSEDLGLECITVKNDSRIFAEQSRQSLETAARESRYRFFARIAREKGCPRLLLAHHADDQVETVLMNLFRGCGLKGLGGMEAVSHREIDGLPMELIRPFLKVSRKELEQYRLERSLPFREDSTNSELIATRNRVRHELIPLVEQIFSRDAAPSILRLSEIAAMEDSAARLRAASWLATHQLETGGLPLQPLLLLPPAELNHVLHLWLRGQRVKDCGFEEVKGIAAMVRSNGKPARINLTEGRFARRRGGIVFVTGRELRD